VSKSRIQIVLLCEDKQQLVFARHFLEKRGFDKRKIIPLIPSVAQSGEQFVRESYLSEVKKYRQKCNHLAISLIVMTDADNLSVKQRLNQLSSILQENNLPDRQKEEAIAIFIPKRNIETWIGYLIKGEKVNEEDKKTYNKLLKESDCKPYAEVLAERCQLQEKLEDAPDSLNVACQEFQRLLPLLN
jgi:hypothetical protein